MTRPRLQSVARLLAIWVAGALAQAVPPVPVPTPFSSVTPGASLPGWRVVGLPGSHKPLTRFDLVRVDGQTVMRVLADHSYANLVHELPEGVLGRGARLRWRWRLDQNLPGADLRHRETDDTALKVCVLFNLPLETLNAMDRGVLGLVRAVSGEKLPAATLCYVWDNTLPVGTLLHNAFTSRIRMLVVDSGGTNLRQWVSHQQDVSDDFKRAFGQEFTAPPLLQAVAVGADADNTGGHSVGYVGDITLLPGNQGSD